MINYTLNKLMSFISKTFGRWSSVNGTQSERVQANDGFRKYRRMKTFLRMIVYLLITSKAYGQQDVLLSQYMFNHVSVNPGYAGSKDYVMATILHRQQWVGWEGAPESNVFSIHGPAGKNLGLGFSLMNDKIGVTSTTDAFGLFSYQLRVSSRLKIGLGIQGGLSYYNYKNSDLIYWDADKTFSNPNQSKLLPNMGTGAFLYSEHFYAGVSVPHIFEYNTENFLGMNSTPANPRKVRHYFGETGVAIKINEDFVLKPSVLVKYVANAPVETD